MEIYLWGLQRDTTGAFSTVQSSSQDGLSSPGNAPHKGGASTPKEARFLEENGESKSNSNKEISTKDLFLMICKTGYGTAIILFVFALAIGISVVDNLAFIYFDFLGSSNVMNGCTVVFTVLFELPLFYLAPNLLKIHGAGRLLLFAGAAYVIRVLGYTLVPVGHMGIVLLLETLHGISYANLKTGSVEFVSWVMPKGYEASGQGVLIFVNYMGVVVGLALGGWIQEVLGPRAMYACMGLIVTTAEIVLIVAENCCPIENPANTSSGDAKIVDEHAHLLGKAESARSGQCNE